MKPLSVKIRNKNFIFRLFPLMLCSFGLFLCLFLGFWQLSRGFRQQALSTQFIHKMANAPFLFTQKKHITLNDQYKTVRISGYFDNKHHFLLDNRFYQHQVGYELLTPLRLSHSQNVILINRGWIAQGNTRNTKLEIPPIHNKITLTGMILFTSPTYTLGSTNEKGWPRHIQTIDISHLPRLGEEQFLPYLILLAKDSPYGKKYNWILSNHSPQRHFAYTFQWFCLAFVSLIAFFAISYEPHLKKSLFEKSVNEN